MKDINIELWEKFDEFFYEYSNLENKRLLDDLFFNLSEPIDEFDDNITNDLEDNMELPNI
jgi:hypothetical protein